MNDTTAPVDRPSRSPYSPPQMGNPLTILAILQAGRLAHEALLLAASVEENVGGSARLVLAEPRNGPLWREDPRLTDEAHRALLKELGAEIRPFETRLFGSDYPNGNKIEGVSVLERDAPFLFLDTDTVVLAPFDEVDFGALPPSASLRREDTWPKPLADGPSRREIWASLYERFDVDFETSLDPALSETDWRHFLYLNAGAFHGPTAGPFGERFAAWADEIARDPGPALEGQALYPWLDQITLPLVLASLGGGRPTYPEGLIDGRLTCHWRTLPLLYARESDTAVETIERLAFRKDIRRFLEGYAPAKTLIYEGRGHEIRARFAGRALPETEQEIRKDIKKMGLWLR